MKTDLGTLRVPLDRPQPDARRFIELLSGSRTERAVPLVEYIIDDAVMSPIVRELLGRRWTDWGPERETQTAYLDNLIEFWYRMGYDVVRFELGLPFPERKLLALDPAPAAVKDRAWADEHRGAITTWEEFERYPWPRVEDFDFFPFEYVNTHLPDGMGLLSSHGGGVFEHLSWIMSMEGLGYALYETPDLVQAITDRLGELMVHFTRQLLSFDRLAALFPGDDMGYRKGTLVSPDHLRRYVLPWHKRFAAMAHARGIPYFLHSCGRVTAVMDDLINDIGIDGKHSFEDAILPAEDFQEVYGDRIAVLGGVDLNVLAGKTPAQVRQRVRELMEMCGRKGRFAVGSGNSVPSYVPVGNFLAMVDEV
ncbi:MAG TPA: uroporphyrinogen decarboxylase family protein, partial [Bacteroidota bacterium]